MRDAPLISFALAFWVEALDASTSLDGTEVEGRTATAAMPRMASRIVRRLGCPRGASDGAGSGTVGQSRLASAWRASAESWKQVSVTAALMMECWIG